MSKIYYVHTETGVRLEIDKVLTATPPMRLAIRRKLPPHDPFDIKTYNILNIPYNNDWQPQDLDYTERFTFDDLGIIWSALQARMQDDGSDRYNNVAGKCITLLNIERKRIMRDSDYDKYIRGDWQ